jgi:hypothetical protein
MSLTVIEDFIPKDKQDELEAYVKDSKFPYRFHKIHNYGAGSATWGEDLQLTHHLMMHGENDVSPHFPIIAPLYDTLTRLYGSITFFRAKVNCTFPSVTMSPYTPQEPHVDLKYEDGRSVPHLVCLYYINNADGPTYFYDGNGRITHKIEPYKGTAVIFDGSIMHAGSNPVNFPYRFAFNINFRQGTSEKL